MRLDELKIKQQLGRVATGSDLARILDWYGWKILGWGAEAGVAGHPSKPYVLKIFPQHSMYHEFLDMARSLKGNPHVPRFGQYARQIPGTKFSYVRMESLSQIREFDLVRWPSLLCLVEKLYDQFKVWPPVWVRTNVSWNPTEGQIDCNTTTIDEQEQAVFDLLATKVSQLGWRRLDLAPSNFMARGSEWVLTDPFI